MLREGPFLKDQSIAFYTVTHVENEGEIYEIYPIGDKVGTFLLISEDGGSVQTLTRDQLDKRGFRPIELVKKVKMKPGTGVPLDLVDILEQMLYATQSVLDWDDPNQE